MPEENLERFRAYHDEILRASREGLGAEATVSRMAEYWHPDVVYDLSDSPWFDVGGVYRGIDAVSRVWRDWLNAWEALRFDYELVDAGDRVVVLLDTRLRGRSTGIEVSQGKAAFVTRFRDGLMIHNKFFASHAEALEAAGLGASSQTTLKLARQVDEGFSAFMRGELSGEDYARCFDPEVEVVWHERAYPDFPQRLRGISEVIAFSEEYRERWAEHEREVLEATELGSRVLSLVRESHRGRQSGVPITFHYFVLSTIHHGKVRKVEYFRHRADALKAADLDD
jgi:ketosteroid isomerase-like protein